tara:strand:+ start:102 stop:692 length:591 start_codon:yes stop_codon:yes gene_type:complete
MTLLNPNAPEFIPNAADSDDDDDAPIPWLADYRKAREVLKEARKARKEAHKEARKARKEARKEIREARKARKALKEARKALKEARKEALKSRKAARVKLATYLRKCVQKDQLIGRIITHFHRKDTMTKAEYEALRGDDFKSEFNGGIKCAVHNLQNTSRAWLRTHQAQNGSIVSVISPTEIRVQDTWKHLIQNALS